MSRHSRRQYLATAGGAVGGLLAGCLGNEEGEGDPDTEQEEEYPTENIHTIIPYGAGGGTDTYARNIGPAIDEQLPDGIGLDLENMPGAGTVEAQGFVADQPSDGYTVLMNSYPGTALGAMVAEPDHYDPAGFVQSCTFALDYRLILSHPDNNLKHDYSALVEGYQDGTYETIGGTFIGTPHLGSYVAKEVHGLDFDRYVGFDGTGPSLESAAAGEIDATSASPGAAVPFVEDGLLEPVAFMTSERGGQFPDLPTVVEQGFDSIDEVGYLNRTFCMPNGTDPEIAKEFAGYVEDALQTDKVQNWSEESGNPIKFRDQEETQEFYDGLFSIPERFPDLIDKMKEDAE